MDVKLNEQAAKQSSQQRPRFGNGRSGWIGYNRPEMEGVDGLVTIDRKWNSGTGHDKFLLSEKKKKNKLAYRE